MFIPFTGVLSLFSTGFYPPSPGTQAFTEDYSILKRAFGYGPYSTRRGEGIDPAVPAGFEVDQVLLYKRHGERFPDEDNSQDYEASFAKLLAVKDDLQEELPFLENWTYFNNASTSGKLTTQGAYAGSTSSIAQGAKFREVYDHLYEEGTPFHAWTADAERVHDTAINFLHGFFGNSGKWTDKYNLTVIAEDDDSLGANTLTPTCTKLNATSCEHKTPSIPQFSAAAKRLNSYASGLNLSSTDIVNIMLATQFEVSIRGGSPWVNVFTVEEWTAIEYQRSYRIFCEKSLGSPASIAAGSVLAKAAADLLTDGPGDHVQNITLGFLHDTQISNLVGGLDILSTFNDFKHKNVTFGNQIQISDIVPMGAHIAFERLNNGKSKYVRLVLNDAVLPIDWCSSGPGFSCPLEQFTSKVHDRYQKLGWPTCSSNSSAPQELTEFWL